MKPVNGKNFFKYGFFYLIIFFNFLFSFESAGIKSKLKMRVNSKSKADDAVDVNDVPKISVNLEDRDGDPLNFVKFNDERRELSNKYADIELTYNAEKHALMKMITHQNAKLAELNEIAKITTDMIKELI
jgi:hypothetical protein